MDVSDYAPSLPVVHQSVYGFGQVRIAECAGQELSQACLRAPHHEVSFGPQHASLGQLTLKESSCRLYFPVFQTVDQGWQKLVKIETV